MLFSVSVGSVAILLDHLDSFVLQPIAYALLDALSLELKPPFPFGQILRSRQHIFESPKCTLPLNRNFQSLAQMRVSHRLNEALHILIAVSRTWSGNFDYLCGGIEVVVIGVFPNR